MSICLSLGKLDMYFALDIFDFAKFDMCAKAQRGTFKPRFAMKPETSGKYFRPQSSIFALSKKRRIGECAADSKEDPKGLA